MTLDPRLDPDTWGDWRWRLSNLYYITDESGTEVKFTPNVAQLELLDNLWYLNIILKARQRGFTTLIDLMGLDQAVFMPNQSVGIIAHGLREAQKIFKSKVRYPYDRLPEQLKNALPADNKNAMVLALANGSSVEVGTSMRSGTVQFLHVSEFGKISRRYPDRAKEIVTGSFNAVHPGQRIFVESTAEGRDGYYYQMCEAAEKKKLAGDKLSMLDFRFHFFPWWSDSKNVLDPEGVHITGAMQDYFTELQRDHGIRLKPEQKAWYAKKSESQGEGMKAEFPSHSKEAFQAAIEGAIFGKLMVAAWAQKRIREVQFITSMPVNTFWDLGRNDYTSIWLHQFASGEHRFPSYYENRLEQLSHYVEVLDATRKDYRFVWGRHYLPHDGANKNLERNESRVDRLVELGIPRDKIVVVPRVEEITIAIEASRRILPQCYFDREGCEDGIKALENYQYEFDEKHGTFRNYPLHNWASNGASAFHQFAMGWSPTPEKKPIKVPVRRMADPGMGY